MSEYDPKHYGSATERAGADAKAVADAHARVKMIRARPEKREADPVYLGPMEGFGDADPILPSPTIVAEKRVRGSRMRPSSRSILPSPTREYRRLRSALVELCDTYEAAERYRQQSRNGVDIEIEKAVILAYNAARGLLAETGEGADI